MRNKKKSLNVSSRINGIFLSFLQEFQSKIFQVFRRILDDHSKNKTNGVGQHCCCDEIIRLKRGIEKKYVE